MFIKTRAVAERRRQVSPVKALTSEDQRAPSSFTHRSRGVWLGEGRGSERARVPAAFPFPIQAKKLRFRVFKACGDSGKQLRKLFALSSRGEETPASLPAKLSLLGEVGMRVF